MQKWWTHFKFRRKYCLLIQLMRKSKGLLQFQRNIRKFSLNVGVKEKWNFCVALWLLNEPVTNSSSSYLCNVPICHFLEGIKICLHSRLVSVFGQEREMMRRQKREEKQHSQRDVAYTNKVFTIQSQGRYQDLIRKNSVQRIQIRILVASCYGLDMRCIPKLPVNELIEVNYKSCDLISPS